ncbi:hypothetical protein F5Y02DRAFT_423670 [Annulohypoxylon stygium]|nr:hypothetical protein F5Y02DRAFT_423670 [Annulohypoxylon stygium]
MSLTTSSGSAAQDVYDITELLEQISLHCGSSVILFKLQRVSKKWRELIKGSSRIQYMLQFSTEPDVAEQKLDGRKLSRFYRMRILMPFLKSINRSQIMDIHLERAYREAPFVTRGLSNTQHLSSGWLAPNASWKKMQFAHPSIKTIHCHQLMLPAKPAATEYFEPPPADLPQAMAIHERYTADEK